MGLWDPIGIFASLTLQVRLLLQSLWQLRVSWDEQLPESVCITFMKAMKAIMDLQEYRTPRRLLPDEFHTNPVELHGFCDGGELAYGAVIWLRYRTEQDFKLKFLTSKAYVAPLKKRSIPRLELMAAVILARLVTTIRTVVNVAKVPLWTDSAIVLHWLHTPVTNFKPFVSTRIQEILETVPKAPNCYRYIKSNLNPADALTKITKNFELSLWHQGPTFLAQLFEHWPHDLPPKPKECFGEEKKNLMRTVFVVNLKNDFESYLLKRISSWTKLLRVTAWLKRPKIDKQSRFPNITASELYYAKTCLFWLAQVDLREPDNQCRRDKLNLEISSEAIGLLRIHGRLNNFPSCESYINPIALPAKSKITRLFAKHMNEKLGHLDYRVIIANLRQAGVFILRGKKLLKSIAAKCIKCRIARQSLMQQQMGQLPPFRLKYRCLPFSSVSIDMFGPIKIKKTRKITTSACVLATACNSTRVVHLEIAETQSINDFIMAWRRFITKRGIHPEHVYSDQGKTFVGAQAP